MLGVKVPPEHIAAAEKLIPQLPALASAVIQKVNEFGERQARIEAALERIEALYVNGDSDTRPAGTGATQSAIERAGGV
jgi:hypothetical protein